MFKYKSRRKGVFSFMRSARKFTNKANDVNLKPFKIIFTLRTCQLQSAQVHLKTKDNSIKMLKKL